MQTKAGGNPGIFHAAALDQEPGAGYDLLTGLKKELNRAFQLGLMLHQHLGGSQKHGTVVIMAAGMHPAGMPGLIRQTGFFGNGQRVSVGPAGR